MISVDSKISAKAMSEKMSEKNTMNVRTIERDIAILKKIGVLFRKGGRTVTSLSCITRFIICDRDVEELTK